MPDDTSVTQEQNPVPPGGVIADPVALAQKMLEWSQRGYHVLSPAMKIWAFAPGYGVNVSIVQLDSRIDANGFGSDTYYDKSTMKDDERAISAMGLKRIAQCAGVAWHPELTTRTDPRTIQNLWEYRAVGLVQDISGAWTSIHGTKEVDFRDGSAQIGGWTPEKWAALEAANKALPQGVKPTWHINGWSEKRVLQARAQGLRLAETKAMSAAIRQLGLKHRYTVAELEQPFMVLRVSYVPDLADPAVRQLVMQRALAGTSALYGHSTLPEPAPARRALEAAVVVDVPSSSVERVPATIPGSLAQPPAPPVAPTPAAATAPPPVVASPAPAAPPAGAPPSDPKPPALPANARFVRSVVIQKTGRNQRGDWVRWAINFEDGLATTTFSKTVATAANDACEKHLPVIAQTENKGNYGTDLVGLELVDTKQMSLLDGNGPSESTDKPDLMAGDIPF